MAVRTARKRNGGDLSGEDPGGGKQTHGREQSMRAREREHGRAQKGGAAPSCGARQWHKT
jgi:hypothetical protein